MYKFHYLFCLCVLSFLSKGAFCQSPAAYVKEGNKSFANGDNFNAAYYYSQALNLDPANKEYLYKCGLANYFSNDYKNANAQFDQLAMDGIGEYALSFFYLAMCKKHLGLYDTAKNYFKEYLKVHGSNDDYFKQKSEMEIKACDTAKVLLANKLNVEIKNAGKNINTVYSDFAAITVNDTALHYTSLQYKIDDPQNPSQKKYVSKILAAKGKPLAWKSSTPMDVNINSDDVSNSNFAISDDKQLAIFCRCTNDSANKQHCQLYESRYKNGWMAASKIRGSINSYVSTSTQPSIESKSNGGYTLYFVSDRPGGLGKLDIWKSNITTDYKYSEPENMGTAINTFDDDCTPWYCQKEQALYFSSCGRPGMGGFDIFKFGPDSTMQLSTINIGAPYNSSYHDLFFTKDNNDSTGMLTSNRPGSYSLKGETCCYDIYSYKILKQKIETNKKPEKNEIEKNVGFSFPLKLYFDNDQPDPHSLKTESKKKYDDLYKNYVAKQGEYVKAYSNAFEAGEQAEASDRINDFFENNVKTGYEKLDKVCEYLEKKLSKGQSFTIMVRGSASSLAEANYNLNLSQRRISSMFNFLIYYNNGSLRNYIEVEKTLKIEIDPRGETEALEPPEKTDSKAFTIYSPQAALSRYIEITEVTIE